MTAYDQGVETLLHTPDAGEQVGIDQDCVQTANANPTEIEGFPLFSGTYHVNYSEIIIPNWSYNFSKIFPCDVRRLLKLGTKAAQARFEIHLRGKNARSIPDTNFRLTIALIRRIRMTTSKRMLATVAGLVISLGGQLANAQTHTTFPTRPITLVVPWNAGGAVDMTARRLAESLSGQGVRVVVENLAGASGTIGLNKVARAAPDGYMLGLATTSLMGAIAQKITPLTIADFTALTQTTEEQEVLVVPSASPVKSIEDLAALMKRTKGGLSIGTPGAYTVNHVYAAMLANAVGVPIVHVAYTGSAKVLIDLAGHQIDAGVLKPSEAQSQVQAGLVRPIGTFATVRSGVFPQAPTFQERGLNVFPYGALPLISYVVAPSGLPKEVETRLIELIGEAVTDSGYQSFAKQYGMTGQNLRGKALQAVVEQIQSTYDVVLPKLPKQ